ncbi:hypothetical protein WCX72_07445 [Sulfurimonas sp. HSL1-6]|uniref:hypothetical protein n=1 Tax=Thiomicrolovo immobilis TaxID=3131935 RepID=UPI0031FA07A3
MPASETPAPFLRRRRNQLLIVALSLLMLLLSFAGTFDRPGRAIVDSSFQQALVVFGTAKSLNAVISVIQGTEVGPPGVTLAVGEVLDPVNDLIERFSWIMLASITSLGIQTIFMNIVTDPLFNYLLLALVLAYNLWLFVRFERDEKPRTLLFKITVIMVFLRFSVPLMALTNDLVYAHFVQPEYNIVELDRGVTAISDDIEGFKKSSHSLFSTSYYTEQVEHYKAEANAAGDQIVRLIIAFVFQTVVFPLLFLFLLYKFVLRLFDIGR